MKVIGLIGGMSWVSSAEYYRLINQLVGERLGGLHSARLLLYSVDFEEVETFQREGRWDDAAIMLADAARALERAGADFLVLCTNTMHKVADALEKSTSLPLLHICDVAGAAIRERGLGTVGLLGTRFTMEQPFYRERLEERFGLRVLIPPEEEREAIHRIVFQELCLGLIEAASKQACLGVIGGLAGRGAEGIVLACTELPLLMAQSDVRLPLFDTTWLHAEAAVKLALSESKWPSPRISS